MGRFDVKIFGERNTATNALKALIETNSASRVFPSVSAELDPTSTERLRALKAERQAANPVAFAIEREAEINRIFAGQPASHAWKHCATRFESVESLAGALVVFCVRHPLSWLLSLFRNPYHHQTQLPDTFEQFLEAEWRLTQRDNLPAPALLPHLLYEAKLQSYRACMQHLEAAGIAFRVVPFEDIVIRQEAVFEALAPALREASDTCAPITRSTKDRAKTIDHYIAYYGAERWRDEIAAFIPAIATRLDKSLFAGFSYSIP